MLRVYISPIELRLRSYSVVHEVSDLSSLQGLVVVIIPSCGFRRKCQGRGDAFHLIHPRCSATYFHMQPTELLEDIFIESIRLSFCMVIADVPCIIIRTHSAPLECPALPERQDKCTQWPVAEYRLSESIASWHHRETYPCSCQGRSGWWEAGAKCTIC